MDHDTGEEEHEQIGANVHAPSIVISGGARSFRFAHARITCAVAEFVSSEGERPPSTIQWRVA